MKFPSNILPEKFFRLLLFVLFPTIVWAQNLSQSPYSRYTLGDHLPNPSAAFQALGGIVLAHTDSAVLNLDQPASLTSLGSGISLFEGGLTGTVKDYTSATTNARGINAGYSLVALAFPIVKKYWSSALHLRPVTNMGYSLADSVQLEIEGKTNYNYTGSGGISAVGTTQAFQLHKNIAFGAELRYLFGKTNTFAETSFPDKLSQVRGSRITNVNQVRGLDALLGLTFQYCFRKAKRSPSDTSIRIQKRAPKLDSLHLKFGFTYKPSVSISGSSSLLAESYFGFGNFNTIVDTAYYRTISSGTVVLPSQLGAGFSLANSSGKWLMHVSGRYTDWAGFRLFEAVDSVRSSYTANAGFQWIPSVTAKRGTFKKAAYRFGAYYSDGFLQFNGNAVQEFGFTLGAGIPFDIPTYYRKPARSSVNLALTFGQRGNVKLNPLQERFVRLAISFSLNDRWFVRTRFE
jgi:hypothetical protein